MLLVSFFFFVACEIAAFIGVATQIGFFWALALLVVVSLLGPLVVKWVGFGVLAQTRNRLVRGESPTRELLDGLVVLIGGLLICVPGFVTDAAGLLLMLGPVRHLVIRMGGKRIARRAQTLRTRRYRVIDV